MADQDDHANIPDPMNVTTETLSAPPLRVHPAPLSLRTVAGFVDSMILALVWVVAAFAIGDMSLRGLFTLTITAYEVVFSFAYYFILEGLLGKTLGKAMLGLRVVDKDGDQCSFERSFKRNVLRFIDWLPLFYILGVVTILSSAERQRVGDRIAGTIVCQAPEKDINPPPAPFLFH